MPRLLRVTSSLSLIICVEWSSAPWSLSRLSRAFLAMGLVDEQIDKAIRTSLRLRWVSLKLDILFLISRMGSRTAGAIKSTSSGILVRALRVLSIVAEIGVRLVVLRPVI